MADLRAELRALHVDWPATPDLAGAVAARLEAPPAPRAAGAAPGGPRSPTASPRSPPRSR